MILNSAVNPVRAILVPRLMLVDVSDCHGSDDNGISHWTYPDELLAQTIAFSIDDTWEEALMPDSPEVRALVARHGLEVVHDLDDHDFVGAFGDGHQGTVQIVHGGTGYAVLEDSQKFSDEFRQQWGVN